MTNKLIKTNFFTNYMEITNIGLKSMVLICPLSSLVIINKSSIFKNI